MTCNNGKCNSDWHPSCQHLELEFLGAGFFIRCMACRLIWSAGSNDVLAECSSTCKKACTNPQGLRVKLDKS